MRLEQSGTCSECKAVGPTVVAEVVMQRMFGDATHLAGMLLSGTARIVEKRQTAMTLPERETMLGWQVEGVISEAQLMGWESVIDVSIGAALCPVCIFKACELTAQLKDTWKGETR